MMERDDPKQIWQELGDACHFAVCLNDMALELKTQVILHKEAFAAHYQPISFQTIPDLVEAVQLLIPGSSFAIGYTSKDHEDGEEALEGWWAILHPGDIFGIDDPVTINGRHDMGLALAEAFCTAAGMLVSARAEQTVA